MTDVGVRSTRDTPDDGELWVQVSAGSHDAFAELFRRHVSSVWNYCYRLTRSRDTAEELTAQTFLMAWRKRSSMTLVRDSARPWLYTVAGNLARDAARSSMRQQRLLRKVGSPGAVPDHSDSVVTRIDGQRRGRRAVQAVRQLPSAQRRAVELCLFGELSVADAAAVLGISEVTVRTNLSRARARLRTLLKDQETTA